MVAEQLLNIQFQLSKADPKAPKPSGSFNSIQLPICFGFFEHCSLLWGVKRPGASKVKKGWI